MVHKKLFIPGPIDVKEDVLQKMTTPMIGHRTKEISALQESISKKVQKVFMTENTILLSTSSGTGMMEGAVHSVTRKKAACFSVGDFGKRWYKMAVANRVPADLFEVEMGKATTVEAVDEALSSGEYDVITMTHNETSTGLTNPVEEICDMMKKKYPDVLILVDCVSSMGGMKIDVDGWGIDIAITSSQKCFGLPPGFALASMNERAYKAALEVPHRGYYFDYVNLYDFVHDKNYQYPSTPSVAHMYALDYQLDKMMEEGMERRIQRHREMADTVRGWAEKHFELFIKDPARRSDTVTTVANTRAISVADLNKKLGERGYAISNGYGSLKDKTFRISHMGDYTVEDVQGLLDTIDEILELN